MPFKLTSLSESAKKRSPRKNKRQEFSDSRVAARQQARNEWYDKGGIVFTHWVRKHYRTHDGEKLTWDDPYQKEFYLAFGNPWFELVLVNKAAQVGFTEVLIAFAAFFLAYLRLPFGLGFEAHKKLLQMSGKRIQPAFDSCEAIQELQQSRVEQTGRQDIDSRETITVASVALSLFHAGFTSNQEDYQAPPSMRSFTAFGVGCDEWGLWPDGGLHVAMARMARTPLNSPILRAGSTPSFEGATVDVEVRQAKYIFQWYVKCPHCDRDQFIDPFGNFLRPVLVNEDGVSEERYVSTIGRPLSWFHHSQNPEGISDAELMGEDRDKALNTAYVGCQHCAEELTMETMSTGHFRCLNTGTKLRKLCKKTTAEQLVIHDTIAIHLPKLASYTFKPIERIKFMFSTKKPDDGIHQFLGKAFSLGGGKISLNRLMLCVGLSIPTEALHWRTVTVAGIDQGRNCNYAIVQRWYLPPSKDPNIVWNDAHVEVLCWEEIQGLGESIDKLVERFNISMVFLDNEPEFQSAAGYALNHLPQAGAAKYETPGQVYLIDQMALKGEQFQRKTRKVQSTREETEIVVYNIDRTYALDCVKWRVYKKKQHFPAGLTYDPKEDGNLLHHYLTSDRLPEGRWTEPQGQPDHWFHANSFCEIGMQLAPHEPGQHRFSFGSLKKR